MESMGAWDSARRSKLAGWGKRGLPISELPPDPSAVTRAAIRKCLLALAAERGNAKTFCPSEAARRLSPEDWRRWMPQVRAEAIRLTQAGKLRCTQRGMEVDPAQARGPLRFSQPLA